MRFEWGWPWPDYLYGGLSDKHLYLGWWPGAQFSDHSHLWLRVHLFGFGLWIARPGLHVEFYARKRYMKVMDLVAYEAHPGRDCFPYRRFWFGRMP